MIRSTRKVAAAGLAVAGMLAVPAGADATMANQPAGGDAASDTKAVLPDDASRAGVAPASEDDDPLTHTVTLITGDVVTVADIDGQSVTSVERAETAEGGIRTQTLGDDLWVVPDAALPYLAKGVLDRDLFNVTDLIEQGYDDASREAIPLIVTYGASSARAAGAPPEGAERTLELESLDGAALAADKDHADDFWADLTHSAAARSSAPAFGNGIAEIHLDGTVEAQLTDSVAQIGAPQAWQAGFDGTGVTVAVLDTGIDLTHPDLGDRVVQTQSFVPDEDVTDVHGHGTHVASTVGGSGAASDGLQKGVAPGSDLVVGKVLDNAGDGLESWIIDGMEWAADNADVVNMSLGSSQPSDGTDPMAAAVNQLSEEHGTLFVIAAGNYGRVGGIGSPGAADAALTVGAVNADDERAPFQDMGPRLGDGAVKPDIVAPGVEILAARSQASDGEGFYTTMSGTSMATPHVAGAAAILAQQHPEADGAALKEALMSSALRLPDEGPYQVGNGRVDVPASLDAQVTATGSLSFGYFDWPHEGDAPVERELTYTNTGDTEVALGLGIEASGSDGAPAPDGLFSLSSTEVTVPAGDTTTVTVTADPTVAASGTTYSGYVVADLAGEPVAHTGVGLVKEDERYELTFRATDRDGEPGFAYLTLQERNAPWPMPVTVDGEVTLRLAPGTYSAMSFMDVHDGPDEAGVAMLGDPEIVLEEDTLVELDAREANLVDAVVTDKREEPMEAASRRMEYHAGELTEAYLVPADVDNVYAAPTEATSDGDFEYLTRWRMRTPFVSVAEGDAPLDVIGASGSAIPDGSSTLETVYAGTGTAEELAGLDVTGKAVVIERDPQTPEGEPALRIDQAGAALLVIVNDEPGEYAAGVWPDSGEELGLVAVTISGTEGASLVPRVIAGEVELTLDGGRNSPYVYDLVDPHPGVIPTDVAYRPSTADLARIDTAYHADRPRAGGEFRYDFRPHSQRGFGYRQVIDFPATRVEYVSAQPGTEWYQDAMVLDGTWNERGVQQGYAPGEETTQTWFAAVVNPRMGEGYWAPNRQGDFLQVNAPSWAGSNPGHTGGMDSALTEQHIAWYQGDTLLKEDHDWQAGWIDGVPAESTEYRVVNDVVRDPENWSTTTASHTEWTFWSERPGADDPWQTTLPFLQARFDVDTGLDGTAVDPTDDTIGLSVSHLDDAAGAGTVEGAELAISYDEGTTWEPLELTGDAGQWSAAVTYPADAEHASLRVRAWDDAGNEILQEVTRAYRLPGYEEPVGPDVSRFDGDNRYGTAAQISREFDVGPEVAYIATGQNYPDALAGAARAGMEDAPVLLTRSDNADGTPADRLPGATVIELERLEPQSIVILGGDDAVPGAVEDELAGYTDGEVVRVDGGNRYGTAAEISAVHSPGVDTVYVATGQDYPDALAAASHAGSIEVPVLLTRSDGLPAATSDELERLQPGQIRVMGGTEAVSGPVMSELEGHTDGDVVRVEGNNRYGTAAEIAAQYEPGQEVTYLATGQDWPDALTGAALAGSTDRAVLLTRTDGLPNVTGDTLLELQPEPQHVTIFGGPAAVNDDVVTAVEQLWFTVE